MSYLYPENDIAGFSETSVPIYQATRPRESLNTWRCPSF